jgi:hypothetical protein
MPGSDRFHRANRAPKIQTRPRAITGRVPAKVTPLESLIWRNRLHWIALALIHQEMAFFNH